MSTYRLIDAERASFPVAVLCKVLGVSRSGYYGWRDRPPSSRSRQDVALTAKIYQLHRRSRETYGSPRVHAELRSIGVRCGRKRVAKLMRKEGLRGCIRGRRKRTTTRRDKRIVPAEDLVRRDFTAGGPDKLWTADITYIGTDEGFLYLAFVLDAYSRSSSVGRWSAISAYRARGGRPADGHLAQETCPRADPPFRPGCSVHFSVLQQETGAGRHRPFYGPSGFCSGQRHLGELRGDAQVRACEQGTVSSRQAAKTAIFEYLEGFYNRTRMHSSLGYRSPVEFEEGRMRGTTAA